MSETIWSSVPTVALELADYSTPDESPAKITFDWASISSLDPLRIVPDGQEDELDMEPETLIDPTLLAFGDRVWVQTFGLRRLILGRSAAPGSGGGGDSGGPVPIPMILNGTWVPYLTGRAVPRYWMVSGLVYVQGSMKGGSTSSGYLLTTMPEGYRPSDGLEFIVTVTATNPAARVAIAADGSFTLHDNVSATRTSFGFCYPAEQ